MKNISRFITAGLIFTGLAANLYAHKIIAITQIVEHPSLNIIREGVMEALQNGGYGDAEIIYESAQGNTAIAAQIAQKYAGQKPDVIIPISTPSAQAVVKLGSKIPVVFAAISDPIGAKVVRQLDTPGGFVTGVMDFPPVEDQLKFIREAIPNVRTIGVVYSPGEPNVQTMIDKVQILAARKGLHIVLSAALKSSDVGSASQALIGRVDAIFVGADNTVVSGLESLIKICLNNRIPLFVSDPDSVKRGAYGAVAYDQKELGKRTGELAVRILNGEKPGNISVIRAHKTIKIINEKTAEKLKLPKDIK